MNSIKKNIDNLASRKLSRRRFMQASGAIGMAGAVPELFLGSAAHAATPVKGGHLRVATVQGSSTDALDPIRLTSGHTNFAFSTFHNALTEIAPNGQLVPLVAESFETGADASEWIFTLRSDVTFHNGKTVTSDDVIVSLNRHRGEESASSMKSFMEEVESITKDGDRVVKFKLKNASVDFPVILSASVLSILPSKDGEIETFDAGCGAYMLESFRTGSVLEICAQPERLQIRPWICGYCGTSDHCRFNCASECLGNRRRRHHRRC